jgi:hypothetical protein
LRSQDEGESRVAEIIVERSGGFTAVPKVVRLERSQLTEAQASELDDLVRAADLPGLPSAIPEDGNVADSFTYRVTVRTDTTHVVNTGSLAMPAPLRKLVDFVNDSTRAAGSGGRHGGR